MQKTSSLKMSLRKISFLKRKQHIGKVVFLLKAIINMATENITGDLFGKTQRM